MPHTPHQQMAPQYALHVQHTARAVWSLAADETIELDSMPPSPSSSSTTPLEWPADIPSAQPLMWNLDTADRLLADNEPSPSLAEIIEWARDELEAPVISPEAAARAVTAVATTTTSATTTTKTATRRSTRARRAPERFATTTRPHYYEVAGIHGHYQVGRVVYYLVSWVGYEADWMWLAESDLACPSLE